MGCKEGQGRTDGNEKYSKLQSSQKMTGEGEQERNIARVEQRGGMYVEVDGWIVHEKYRESRAE